METCRRDRTRQSGVKVERGRWGMGRLYSPYIPKLRAAAKLAGHSEAPAPSRVQPILSTKSLCPRERNRLSLRSVSRCTYMHHDIDSSSRSFGNV